MLSLSYNISTHLRQNLLAIEKLRRSILLTPMTVKDKRILRFEATVKRTYYGTNLTSLMTITDLSYFLMVETNPLGKRIKDKHLKDYIIHYKNTLEYIYGHWSVTVRAVDTKTLQYIGKLLGLGRIRNEGDALNSLLEYLETQHDSPIIQSGLAMTQFPKIALFSDKNSSVAHIMALLYLYKGAYDFRGLVAIDEELQKNRGEIQNMLRDALRTDNQTIWLEYYTDCFVRHLEHLQARLSTMLTAAGWHSETPGEILQPTVEDITIDSMAQLNSRQRSILTLIETPSSRITNKYVQEAFQVSQITASRDLAKLTILGLLVVHAHGRSTYYTKT